MIPSTWCMQRKAGTEQAKKNKGKEQRKSPRTAPKTEHGSRGLHDNIWYNKCSATL